MACLQDGPWSVDGLGSTISPMTLSNAVIHNR